MLAVAYLTIAFAPHAWWLAPFAITAIGLGFYMLHNTLQTNATQMTPEARGTAVAIFSSALYLGQTLGVAINALVFDRFSAVPVFVISALGLLALGPVVCARAAARHAQKSLCHSGREQATEPGVHASADRGYDSGSAPFGA